MKQNKTTTRRNIKTSNVQSVNLQNQKTAFKRNERQSGKQQQ